MNISYENLKIPSSAERYAWATYGLFVALSSIVGDTVILVASGTRDSFRLNKFLVTIMQHIAVCDISVSITHILPSAISLIADSWIFGEALCYIQPYLTYYFYPANMALICTLTTGKLLLLRKPARARNWSKKQAHVICSVVWASNILTAILFYMFDKDDISFDYRNYSCEYGFSSHTFKRMLPFLSLLGMIFPNITMITTTIPTLKYLIKARKSAKRTKKSVPWQGALTVSLTAFVYCVSTLPVSVYQLGRNFLENRGFDLLYRYGCFISWANIWSNFFIYTLTITSFRRYLLNKIKEISTITLKSKPITGISKTILIDKGRCSGNKKKAKMYICQEFSLRSP